jgi:hypothetical protein
MDVKSIQREKSSGQLADFTQSGIFPQKFFFGGSFRFIKSKRNHLSFKFYWNLWYWAVDRPRRNSQSIF